MSQGPPVAGLCLLLAFTGCHASSDGARNGGEPLHPAPGRSVLLVSFDTLRADRLAPEGPMPRLRELAGRGVHFVRAHAQVPLTLPSHATMLTGLGPDEHGVRDNIGYALEESAPTVAGAFTGADYATAAFVAGYPLDRASGLSSGFAFYDDTMTRTPQGTSGHTERRAGDVVAAARDWLEANRHRTFFLFVHFFDPHDPYEAPAPFAGRHSHPYDDEVAYADHALGALLDALESGGGEAPWIFVTADHGEALGEHGEPTHGVFLYESTLHVPLVIVPPYATDGRTIDAPVSLLDLAPTMLRAAGLEVPSRWKGRSLLGAPAGLSPAAVYLESIHGRSRYGWAPLSGYLDWPTKFIAAPHPELYDLERDPAETRNLYSDRNGPAHRDRLGEILGDPAEPDLPADVAVDLERMASLGYLGGSAVHRSDEVLFDRPRPDAKERIAALVPLNRGLAALAEGRADPAESDLREALRLDPDNLVALNNLGILALQGGQPERAVELFRRGLDRDASAENLANNLGMALARLGRHREAAAAYRQALKTRPGFTAARFNLALALYREGNPAQALQELEAVRDQEPDFPGLAETIEQIQGTSP